MTPVTSNHVLVTARVVRVLLVVVILIVVDDESGRRQYAYLEQTEAGDLNLIIGLG